MLISFYFFIIPLVATVAFTGYKYFIHRKELEVAHVNAIFSETKNNNLEEAFIIVYNFYNNLKFSFLKGFKLFFHWVLHFFVIFLGFISDLTDILYAKARDFFLKTASREKHAVSTFWHTLKEYKKESEEEKKEND